MKTRFAEGLLLAQRDEPVVTEHQRRESDVSEETVDDVTGDPVLAAPWNQRGTVEVAVALSDGGSPVKRRRFGLLTGAELGQLTGLAAHDAGQAGLGQRYHIAALRAAHSAGDRLLGAHILACMADEVDLHGRPAEAVTLIETAEAGTTWPSDGTAR